jgi:hypothetical protein
MIAPADSAWNSSKDKSSFADFLDQSLRLADKILTGTRHYLRRLLTTVGYEGGRRCFPLVERKWPSKRRSSVVWTVSRVDKRIGPSLRGFIQLKWCWRSTNRLSPSSSSHVLSCSHSETCPGRNQLENLNCHFHSIPWNDFWFDIHHRSSFVIWFAVRPVWVAISGTEKPLSAGKSYTIECATGGSRPSANIHWYLHSIQQQAATERVRLSSIQFFLPFPGPSNFLIAIAATEITREIHLSCQIS